MSVVESNFNLSFDSDCLDDSFNDPDFVPPANDNESSDDDPTLQEINKKKVVSRVQKDNMVSTTEEFLEASEPKNSKRSALTAVSALKSVIGELHGDEKRDILDIPIDVLVEYLEEFFKCAVKQDGSSYNASSLGAYYNALSRYFLEKRQIDIKKDVRFCRVGKILSRRQEESAKLGEIPGKNAKKAIPQEVLAEVIAKGKIGFDDPRALTANVVKSFQAGFGIRNREEMYSIQNGDIEVGPLKANGIPEYIELSERITKTRRGKSGHMREYKPRIVSNDDKPGNCLLRPFLMMQAKKTSAQCAADQPLFWTCLNSKDFKSKSIWFANQRMGIGTIGNIVATQIKSAGFDTRKLKIGGSSVRKNMFDSLMENEVPGVYASAHGGHSSVLSKESYVTSKEASKRAINTILADSLNGEEPSNFNDLLKEEKKRTNEGIKKIRLMENEDVAPEGKESVVPPREDVSKQPPLQDNQVASAPPLQPSGQCSVQNSGYVFQQPYPPFFMHPYGSPHMFPQFPNFQQYYHSAYPFVQHHPFVGHTGLSLYGNGMMVNHGSLANQFANGPYPSYQTMNYFGTSANTSLPYFNSSTVNHGGLANQFGSQQSYQSSNFYGANATSPYFNGHS